VEIGNENSGKIYDQRYNLFYKAIKEKYPQLTLISNHGLNDLSRNILKTDMIDPHWYVEPDYFFRNANVFDSTKREGFKIYVGEYACNKKVGGGNMLAALSEAAFLTGMERNSDLVTMASYAPLFENRNDRTWPVNLIWIDNDKVVGRSSYYVQKMFAENRPSVNLSTKIVLPELPDKIPLQASGSVGLGSQVAQVEYKNLKVYSENHTLLLNNPVASDFNFSKGEWKELNNITIAQNSLEMRTAALLIKKRFENCIIEFDACKKDGVGSLLFYFGMSEDAKTGYAFRVGAGVNNTTAFLQKVENGELGGRLSESIQPPIVIDKWVSVKIIVGINHAELSIDNVSVLKYTAKPVCRQFAISGYDATTKEIVVKVVNAESSPFSTTIKLLNSGKILRSGKVITLSASKLDDENSFEESTKIVPVQMVSNLFSSNFNYLFEPNSLTILRIKEQK
jgi:alpha-L-arabinofuranosidase